MRLAIRLQPWNVEVAKLGPPDLPPVESLEGSLRRPVEAPHPQLPYQNLAFEGGGVKALAYVGALEVLEEVGLYPRHIRRVAGSSSGSFLAAMVAVGCSAEELGEITRDLNLGAVLQDARFGWVSGIYNMFTMFGLNPGARLLEYLGEQLRLRTGSADVTFQQVLERCGRELCVPVTNLTRMRAEYFHPKTTPDMPVRLAVGMSMSLPVLMVPYRVVRTHRSDNVADLYTDGGLVCNYPLHAFDGWWLSLDREDTFLKRLQPLSDAASAVHDHVRFTPRNPATLGFTVFERAEIDATQRWALPEGGPPPRPRTALAGRRQERERRLHERSRMAQALARAADRLVQALAEVDTSGEGEVDREECRQLFAGGTLPPRDAELLFGTRDPDAIFDQLDHDQDGKIRYDEVIRFIDSSNVPLTAHRGLALSEPSSIPSFLSAVFQTVWAHMRQVTLRPDDSDRTVPINTDYVSTADFHLDPDDRAFLLEAGRRSTRAFLAHHHGSSGPT